MNNSNSNSKLEEMLVYKKSNPPQVTYSPTFKINGIIHKIKLDLHGKGTMFEYFTYNNINNKIATLIYYHKNYIPIKKTNKKTNKKTKTKTEEEIYLYKILNKLLKEVDILRESCMKEHDLSKRKEIILMYFEKNKQYYNNINEFFVR